MPQPLTPLVDFLNHGILPFTGRTAEAEKIMGFWRGAADSHGLQAMLLFGEAGMGKSRMVEEIASGIKRANGAVIHTKLYPESATSIAPLMARAIWRFSAAHPLLKIEPEENLASVVGALRRLMRVRQTLLIFEDIHLLNGEGIADFAALLDALSDEQAAVLFLARPVELGVRALLERHLVDEIELAGLGRGEIADLWSALFGTTPTGDIVDIIIRATTGNPLALRSALRGALKSGAIAQDGHGTWHITLSTAAFEDGLARSVRLLSEGMAAHLSEKERQAAGQIACLGEVLSYEAAIAMADGDEHMLERLSFKGIVVETGTLMPPLTGESSARPLLAFTHTLLHRRLAENAAVDARKIARMILADLPLYSTVAFRFLADHAADLRIATTDAMLLVDRAVAVVVAIDNGPDWRLGLDVWNVARGIFELHCGACTDDERFVIQARLFESRMRLLRGQDSTELYKRTVREFVELTDRPLSGELMPYRLWALRSLYWLNSRRDYPSTHAIREQVDVLVLAHPALRVSRSYIDYLARVASAAIGVLDFPTVRSIESELAAIRALPDITEEMRQYAWRTISPNFLMVFQTPEELETRLALLAELDADPNEHDKGLILTRITVFVNIGNLIEARAAAAEALPWYRDRGQHRSAFYCELVRLHCTAALEADIGNLEAEAEAICAEADEVAHRIRSHAATYFAVTGILRGDAAWGKRVSAAILAGRGEIDPALQLGLALGMDDADELDRLRLRDDMPFTALMDYIGGGADIDAAVEAGRLALHEPLCRTSNLLSITIVADIIGYLTRHGRKEIGAALEGDAHEAIGRALEWLYAKRLFPYMAAILSRFDSHLDKHQRALWNARLAGMAHAAAGEASRENNASIVLSMLGSIEASIPGAEPVRPRGVRLRTLLGLMVADLTLEKPLSQREFCRLAAGDAAEFEDARKTVNLAVHRLREMLGHEAILTDQDTPRLNIDRVRVDLLNAHHLLNEAAQHLREGSIPRAFRPLLDALDIARGEVPYPTLYDDFFEAAREDFENRIRSSVLRVANGLLHDGDAAGAESILRRAFAAMPEDEELATMLSGALIKLGKRAEAERVRLQSGGPVPV